MVTNNLQTLVASNKKKAYFSLILHLLQESALVFQGVFSSLWDPS